MASDPLFSHPHVKRWQKLGDKFHMMIGYCIAAWADVDDVLFQIFNDCVGPRKQSAIVYFRTPGLDSRFKMTGEIVLSVLPRTIPGKKIAPEVRAWETAIKGHGELLATRRRIAHHPVAVRMSPPAAAFGAAQFGKTMFGDMRRLPSAYELYMSEAERLRGHSADKPALRLGDLERHYESVGDLATRILAFHIEILSVRPQARP